MSQPFAKGDVVRVTEAFKARFRDDSSRTTKTWSCHVTQTWRGHSARTGSTGWWFSYVPCQQQDSVNCAWGHGFFSDEPTTWGVQSVEIIDHKKLEVHRPFSPQPGDRAYDLMC